MIVPGRFLVEVQGARSQAVMDQEGSGGQTSVRDVSVAGSVRSLSNSSYSHSRSNSIDSSARGGSRNNNIVYKCASLPCFFLCLFVCFALSKRNVMIMPSSFSVLGRGTKFARLFAGDGLIIVRRTYYYYILFIFLSHIS